MVNRDTHFQDLLSAVSDSILADENDGSIDLIFARYDIARSEIEPFITIIRQLRVSLIGVRPSPRFAQRLRAELIGTSQWGVLGRVRYLPPRVQLMAGVMILASFMLLSRRRLRGEEDASEISIAS